MEIKYEGLEVWFITGSQSLYGEAALTQVAQNAGELSKALDTSPHIPIRVRFIPVLTTPEAIYTTCLEANASSSCIGLVVWMHTFSPARMWIRGLNALQKPVLHLHTQFNRDIPWGTIDMDFMNLNQSAHGDREFGFIMSRMQLERKIVAGHWKDSQVQSAIGAWVRVAAGWNDWQGAKFARFGDNMRQVAVTEGDKVEAEIKFGYAVNGYGVGDLVKAVNDIDDKSVDVLVGEYQEQYQVTAVLQKGGTRHTSLRDAARIELGLGAFLRSGGFKGFTDTFEDLHGLKQLPGIAVQRLMAEGYGFGGEGDWKTAALVRAMKVMGHGLKGGNSFMEDYTYHFDPADPLVLGAHMLEICPSIADGKPSCEIHPLGIGGKDDPVRLVFNCDGGPALNATIIDLGNRFRLLVNEVEAVRPRHELPKLPVARVLWKPLPDMLTGCTAWIYAGGAHHTGYSQNLTTEHMECFADIAGIEFVKIGRETDLYQFKNMLRLNTNYYR